MVALTHPRSGRSNATAAAARVLSRYPEGLDLDVLLTRACRDEGIDLFDAYFTDIRGVLRLEPAGWRVYLSRHDAPRRRLLTLAHLLGHYFLHAADGDTFVEGPLTGGV